jgi:putative transposase
VSTANPAFIESWFGQFKKRCARRAEWETLDQARAEIAAYVDEYHHRPHFGLGYRRPPEAAATWREGQDLQTRAT